MNPLEQLQEQIHALELRITALERAVWILQGHAPDEIIASGFDDLWSVLLLLNGPGDLRALEELFEALRARWAPDDVESATRWLNTRAPQLGDSRPIDLIRAGHARQVLAGLQQAA